MGLDDFIIAVFCVVDEAIPRVMDGRRLRQRGPQPRLADSEVVPMEVVGEYLGVVQDSSLFNYFRRHYAHCFPALRALHRTTFIRQAANLWRLKEHLWQHLLDQIPHDPTFAILDSLPLPICQFARAYRCRRFRGEAAFGKDPLVGRPSTACESMSAWSGLACSPASAWHRPMCTSWQPGRRSQLLAACDDRRMAGARRRCAGAVSLGQ